MGKALLTNNAKGALTAGVLAGDLSFSITAGKGALFPNPTAGDYFYATITDAATSSVVEIVKVTARSTDTFTVARAQQGTTALAWSSGDLVQLRPTAYNFSELATLISPSFTTPALGTPASGDLSNCTNYPVSGILPTGVVNDYIGTTAPSGWVMLAGKTIGDGSSGGTERANADTSDLFTLLWNSMADTEAPVSGGRGVSAAADFAAHKTITVPDARGRVVAGKDNMGGSAANRLTAAGSGITGTTLGTAGGSETHTLTTAQLASHAHDENTGVYAGGGTGTTAMKYPTVNSGAGGLTYSGNTASGADAVATVTTATAGSGTAHNNTQPTLVLNKIIKL